MEISEEPKTEIKVPELPEDMRLEVPEDKLSEIELSETEKRNSYHYRSGKRAIPLKALDKKAIQKLLSISKARFGNGGNAASAKFPTYLNPKIAYLVGALRDGTINNYGKYEVCYVQKDIRWLQILKKLIEEVFDPSSKPRLIVREGNTPKITMSNRVIFEFFRIVFEVKPGYKIDWGTPKVIKNAPLELQKFYVRGYFDADGVSGINIGFCQANLESLLFIRKLLKKLGIETRKIESRKTSKGNDFYYLYIRTKDQIKFFTLIGSSNPSKFPAR